MIDSIAVASFGWVNTDATVKEQSRVSRGYWQATGTTPPVPPAPETDHTLGLYKGGGGSFGAKRPKRHPLEGFESKKFNSSTIHYAGYNEESKSLRVIFKDGGIYEFSDVDDDVAEGFFKASSAGNYFYRNIRGTFAYRKLR